MKLNPFSILIMTRNYFHDLFRSPKHARRRLPALKCLSVHTSGFGSDELSVISCEILFYKSNRVHSLHHMLTTDKLLKGQIHIIQIHLDFFPWNTKGEFLKNLAALFHVSEMGSVSVTLKLHKTNKTKIILKAVHTTGALHCKSYDNVVEWTSLNWISY